MNQVENAIVVAVPVQGGDAALRFAVDEASRSGSPVHLVHVLQLPAAQAYAGVYEAAMDSGQSALDSAQRRAKELSAGNMQVSTELVTSGWVVHDLVARSRSARMVVLEHRAMGRLRRLAVGSTSNGIAARSESPVVVVPEGWDPAPGDTPVITAAVQDPREADEILRAAFEEARERGASLVVLHSWWLANGYDDVVVDQTAHEDSEARVERDFTAALEPFRDRYPMVEVTLDVRHSPPAEAVLAAADRSDLLVLGRRHHLLPLGSHLGPVARAVLGHSTVPVLVTPEPQPLSAVGGP